MASSIKKRTAKYAALSKEKIDEFLREMSVSVKTFVYDLIPSTNLAAESFAKENPGITALFIAEEQSAGSGRLGRRFHSPKGAGLYMSLLISKKAIKTDGVWLTSLAAVAVRRALKNLCTLDPQIKWVNDLYIGGKKLAGILTKAALNESGKIDYAIVGIGINLYKAPLPDEIKEIATSLEAAGGGRIDKNALAAEITKELLAALNETPETLIKEYKAASLVLGKRIRVIGSGEEYYAIAKDITDSGELVLLNENREKEILSTGEISIRDF